MEDEVTGYTRPVPQPPAWAELGLMVSGKESENRGRWEAAETLHPSEKFCVGRRSRKDAN